MDKNLSNYRVQVPASCMGEVLGELNRRGGWLDDATSESGISIIQARVPPEQMINFEQWLHQITDGKGVLWQV